MTGKSHKMLLASFGLASLLLGAPCFADSQVRIVRLSEVEGSVQIDRDLGQGYEKAFLNFPVAQDTKLRTGADGRAEIELEDGSTVRIAPNTVIEFPHLALRDSGAKVSVVAINQGIAYVDFAAEKDDEFTATFGQERVSLSHPAHLRLGVGDGRATLAVFKGEVQVNGPSKSVSVESRHSAVFDLDNHDSSTVAKNFEEDPNDAWDKQQGQYHQQYASRSYNSYSPYAYGTTDMNYYGSFSNVAGYGMLWQPYFAGAGWDPFMNGAWAYSPGFGYGWVSAYPWGWTPYHTGTWLYLRGTGWAWQPGSTWAAFNTVPAIASAPQGYNGPVRPAVGNTLVTVNRGPAPVVKNGFLGSRLVIPDNSAGLGVPRGAIKNLPEFARSVRTWGSASASLRTAPVVRAGSSGLQPVTGASGFQGSGVPAVVHTGSTTHSGSVSATHR